MKRDYYIVQLEIYFSNIVNSFNYYCKIIIELIKKF